MQNIESLIQNNPQYFNNQDPPEGHTERFTNKMLFRKNKTKKKFMYLKIAALCLAFLTIGVVGTHFYEQRNFEHTSLSSISNDYQEVESFYQNNVNKKLEQINNLKCELGTKVIKDVLAEFKMIDANYSELQKNLAQNENDQRIIAAMIACYQSKLDILSKILQQINNKC